MGDSRVWATDAAHGWTLGTVQSGQGTGAVTVQLDKGEVVVRKPDEVVASHQSEPGELKSVADLTKFVCWRARVLHPAVEMQ